MSTKSNSELGQIGSEYLSRLEIRRLCSDQKFVFQITISK